MSNPASESSLPTTAPQRGNITGVTPPPLPSSAGRKGLTKHETAAAHPTSSAGRGDLAVRALNVKRIEKRNLWRENITTVAGIGCSIRFPYFGQAHGAHYRHGRALPFPS